MFSFGKSKVETTATSSAAEVKCDHTWFKKSMFTKLAPHYCDYCQRLIMIYELPCHSCSKCDKFLHSGCFQQILHNKEAALEDHIVMKDSGGSSSEKTSPQQGGKEEDGGDEGPQSPAAVVVERAVNSESAPAVDGKVRSQTHVHQFEWKTFFKPTFCSYCNKILLGFKKQGLECRTCDTFAHEECIPVDSTKAIMVHANEEVKSQFFNYQTASEEKRAREAKSAEHLALSNTMHMIEVVNKRNKKLPQSALNPMSLLGLYKKHAELYRTAVASCSDAEDLSTSDLTGLRSILRYATAAYGLAYDEGFFASNFGAVLLRLGNQHVKDPKPEQNTIAVANVLGLPRSCIHYATWSGEVFKPNYYILLDQEAKRVVLCFRGSLSDADFLSDATGELMDFVDTTTSSSGPGTTNAQEQEEGYKGRCHVGIGVMIAEVLENEEAMGILKELLAAYPSYDFVVTGHSLGAGLTTLFVVKVIAENFFNGRHPKGYPFAPPPLVTLPLAEKFDDYLCSVVAAKDCVSRLQYNTTDRLCHEIAVYSQEKERDKRRKQGLPPLVTTGSDDEASVVDSATQLGDLTEEVSIPGKIYLITKPTNAGTGTRLIKVPRTHILLHQIFLSKYMITNHHMHNYDKGLEVIIAVRNGANKEEMKRIASTVSAASGAQEEGETGKEEIRSPLDDDDEENDESSLGAFLEADMEEKQEENDEGEQQQREGNVVGGPEISSVEELS